jgi:NADPH:quinone reductase-like Zn-dependent oxidoreductase
MRAVVFDHFGPPEVLRVADLPSPVPTRDEVVVKVTAATVNPTDLLMRSGQQAKLMTDLVPPYIAGMEFAGYVHRLGGDSSRLRTGQAVIGIVNPRRPQGGAHCEYVCVPVASVVAAPNGMDMSDAATIPMNGLTAHAALQQLDLHPGAMLLVTGGAGALGGYVIQLARHAGLKVIADAKEEDRKLLTQLGAAEVVPRGPGMSDAVRARHPSGVDGLLDAALIGDAAAALVRNGGTVVSVRRSQVYATTGVAVKSVGVLDHVNDTEALTSLSTLAQQGVITPRVTRSFPFAQAAEANRMLERGGLRGRVVLVP